ncbi:hypothetical protein SDC9_209144 [bioreactor metagenome]|uniref:Uncharacterized protein n=1 Tax=bioreactor metagenome TaxID=1076179 RepID=A0A645JDJ7_9ZZZZ
MIRPAVAHVADHRAAAVADGGDQCRSHILEFLTLLRRLPDRPVGKGHRKGRRLPQLLRRHRRRQHPFKLSHISIHRNMTCLLTAGGTAHAVADDADSVSAVRLPHGISVLIILADKTHVRDAPDLHVDHSPFCSSMAFRRSCPQEASISPPRLRRTVAVSPWVSSRF